MRKTTPTCPYCGGWMRMNADGEGLFWAYCVECNALSLEGKTKDDALNKALHRVSPWHSVKDGLPESGTINVVHGRNKRGVDCYDIAIKGKTGWEFGSMSAFAVEHWMPVPDAPKEVQKHD